MHRTVVHGFAVVEHGREVRVSYRLKIAAGEDESGLKTAQSGRRQMRFNHSSASLAAQMRMS